MTTTTDVATIRACGAVDRHPPLLLPHGVPVEEAISLVGKTWEPGETIFVAFLDGSPAQRAKARRWMEAWLDVANLRFAFDAPQKGSDVRVSFTPGGSWSMIGTDCRRVRDGATMQLGWVTDASTEESDRAVILHETGHLLGLGHEQSSPHADIHWDVPRAERYYEATQGWTPQMVHDNVFAVFAPDAVNGTTYDRASIMQYPVPAELTTDGRGIGWNTTLSDVDRAWVRQLYPMTAPPVPSLPMVVIGAPARAVPIPAPGRPAEFRLLVDEDRVLHLAVVVTGAFGRDPVVVVEAAGQAPVALGIPRGGGRFRFDRGAYAIRVWNPLPRMTGVAWVKAMPG